MFLPVTAEEMQAARLLTGATMAAWLASGVIPAIRPHTARIRLLLLVAYLLLCAAFVTYVLVR